MKIREVLLDSLNRTFLFEMAYSRRRALEIVGSYDDTLAVHLVKILAFQDREGFQHHCNEINSCFSRMNRIRWNRTRLLSNDNFLKQLWEGPFGHGVVAVIDIINGLVGLQNYQEPRSELAVLDVYEKLQELYLKFCRDLSGGEVKQIQVYLKNI